MALHYNTTALMIADGMRNMIVSAAQVAANRRAQAVLDAWSSELANARDDAEAMGQVAAHAIRQLAEVEGENAGLRDEVARLRALLASRNALIRQITQ